VLGIKIKFVWSKYSDYEFEEEAPRGQSLLGSVALGPTLVGRGAQLTTKPLEKFPNLYLRLASSRSDAEGQLEFARLYGLLRNQDGDRLLQWQNSVESMQNLVDWTNNHEAWPSRDGDFVTQTFERRYSIAFAPNLEGSGLDLWIEPDSLFSALVLQCLSHASAGGSMRPCKACGSLFEIGGAHGLRSHAVFCGDECRSEFNHRSKRPVK
jgi:hypothetical protein